MGVGFQAFDANGRLLCDGGDRVGRVIGVVPTNGGNSGVYVNDALIAGQAHAVFCGNNGRPIAAQYSISGSTFSWWRNPSPWAVDGFFVLVVF